MEAVELQVMPPDWREVSDEEFQALQEEAERCAEKEPDERLVIRGWELLDGRLVPMSPVKMHQARAAHRIAYALETQVMRTGEGEVVQDALTWLDDSGLHRVYPDVVYIGPDDKASVVGDRILGPPRLVVEITCPESIERDTVSKKALYHRFEVEWYWIVNLVTGETEEFRWAEAEYELVSRTPLTETFRPALFPDLEINLPTG